MNLNPILIAELASKANPLTLELDSSFDDLKPLDYRLREAKVVALGSSVRVSHELLTLTQRVMRCLVEEHGFRVLVLEGDEQAGYELDRYVRSGEGNPHEILAQARSFLRFAEILDAIRWIRMRNEKHPEDQVHIVQFTDVPVEATAQLSEREQNEQRIANGTIEWQARTQQRIVYWGGLAHTGIGLLGGENVGSLLREGLGTAFVSVALCFHDGLIPFRVDAPPSDYVEALLGEVNLETYLIDIQRETTRSITHWLDSPAKMRLIGPGVHELSSPSLRQWFDFVIHARSVTAAEAL